jgi:integrase/recombinase XerD
MHAAEFIGTPARSKGLRHAFGLHAIQSKVSLPLLRRWLGHLDVVGPTNTFLPLECGDQRIG